jgi:glycosyltransferase involved in cell wall biosynthesis
MKILYFGSYKPSYPRNKIILDGLRENGVEVVECNVQHGTSLRLIKLFVRYLQLNKDFDYMIVAFPGQEIMFLARLICWKPIIFDVFTSHYMGYILDRKYFSENSLRAKYYRFMDTWSCKLANIILLDTQAHIDYFVKEFNLPAAKFRRIWLGANSELHHPVPKQDRDTFSALFWGSFIPLQGVEYIIRAAKILENEPIVFNLSGRGQTYEYNKKLADDLKLKNVNFLGRTSDEELAGYIRDADVCLGTYSDGLKADITIQNKIFESLASKKTIITEKTTSIQELLNDGQGVLWCNKADPVDLAKKILTLKNNSELNQKIAEEGYKLFLEKLTPYKIGQDLVKILA